MDELHSLPFEVLVEILSKLSIKTLIICASTCKWLLFFISKPYFMVAQMEKTPHNNPLIFLKYFTKNINKNYFSLQPADDTFNGDFTLIDMPLRCCSDCDLSGCCFHVVGSCNGVICLFNNGLCKCGYSNSLFLWNPSIKKSIVLPIGGIAYDVVLRLGFGFDSRTNDFKVIRVRYSYAMTPEFKGPIVVEVYSVRLKLWRVVESFIPKFPTYELGYSQCFVNGALHWLESSNSSEGVIVVFNVEDELFGGIKMPEFLVDDDSAQLEPVMKLGKCGDKLALIRTTYGSNVIWSVWVMREYGVVDSWSEICHLDIPGRFCQPVAFGFRKSEEIILFVSDEDVHDLDRRHLMLLVGRNGVVIKVLGMVDAKSCSLFINTYTESLALFMEGRAILDNKFQGDCLGLEKLTVD